MKYTMTKPCDACPFLRGSGFTFRSLLQHASGEFGCHKACDLDEQSSEYVPHSKTPHCAGALIFLEKRGTPHQMMRVCERLGLYDMRLLDMSANVGSMPRDYREESAPERKRAARAILSERTRVIEGAHFTMDDET